MRKFLMLLFITFLVIACQESKKGKEPLTTIINDSIISEHDGRCLQCFSLSKETKDTTLLINNEPYVLTYSSVIDTSETLTQIDVYSSNGKNYKDIFRGYNAYYTVSLKDSNRHTIFSKKFLKKEFGGDSYDKSIVVESGANMPKFKGYLSKFDSFLFTLEFWVPDSDIGLECFFMLDRKGNIIKNFVNNWFGGGDCDGTIEVSPSKDFILTCRSIINTNGKIVNLDKEDVGLVCTKLINDSIILVIEQFNDTTKLPNAILMNNFGKVLKKFNYQGYYNVLGYIVPIRYDSRSENYYLFDQTLKNIRTINRDRPLGSEALRLDLIESYDGNQRAHEVKVVFKTEGRANNFYIDSITQQIRYEGGIGKK
ncbi:MAG: hypothetical protein J7604_21225 [Sporocytophaga sp.]|uniref:hypothetical protein n=1 Tax=Sporocytophaga sp. TaxID=2231183 RepID=UPI001B16F8F7|nr:hypothetical protein [Sporocytophaga sp.]MBO9702748.1 hypothetical protein [Sporocytophaga sp.]